MMNKLIVWSVLAAVVAGVLQAAGPTLIRLMNAAVPGAVLIACVVIAARIVWHFTSRY